MRKLKPRMKKIIAMLLVALTINTSISSAAVMPVQASTMPLASELVAALLSIFGYTYGYGTTLNGSNNTNQEMFAEMQAAWNAGESFEVDGTEVPDLRVAANFTNFVEDAYTAYSNFNGGNAGNDYLTQLNIKSYKASGTLVTKTYLDALAVAKEHIANTAEDVLTTELDTFFSAVTDDDAEISDFNALSMYMGTILAGIAVRSQVDATNTWTNAMSSEVYTDDYNTFTGTLNGSSFQFCKTNVAKIMTNKYGYIFEASEPVLFLTFMYSGYNYVCAFGPNTFDLTYETTDTNWLTISKLTSNVKNSYQYTYPNTIYKFQMSLIGTANGATIPLNTSYVPDETLNKYVLANYDTIFNSNTYDLLGNAETMDSSVTDALSAYGGRAVTKSKLLELRDALDARAATAAGTETATAEIAATITEAATALPEAGTSSGTGTGEYSSILDKILAAIQAIAAAIWGFFSEPLSGIKSAIDVFPAILEDIGSIVSGIPESIWEYVEPSITAIQEKTTAIVSQNTKPWDEDNTERSNDSLNFFNGLFLLILIIIKLLQIFWHCLQFIVAIFEIPPSTAFLPDDVISGLHYIKAIEITGIGMSVYDFMMGLIYIIIIFSVIRVLRKNVDRIHVPGSGIKKG